MLVVVLGGTRGQISCSTHAGDGGYGQGGQLKSAAKAAVLEGWPGLQKKEKRGTVGKPIEEHTAATWTSYVFTYSAYLVC